MNTFQAIVTAIVEGLTEFIPISSTAHMRFTGPLIGLDDSTAFVKMYEVVIQLAAILAVVVLYRKKFLNFSNTSFYLKLILAMVPAIIAGLLLKKHIDAALDNLQVIAFVMIGGGIVFLFIDRVFKNAGNKQDTEVSYKKAFIIGCGQVLSIIFPGLSRSAATIITGMSQKLSRQDAAEFSFFLAVPTMFAASVKSFWDVYKEQPEVLNSGNLSTLLIGSAVSFIVALLAIKFFIGFLKKHGFFVWGVYRIIIGILILVLIAAGIIHN
ncbi:MAG TPA: undecaprenyl-diphosphate phosphatase [Ferruginibacter sp.]|nr:undecaprenyl-diphosphate phosphatase [Ferruginibacter sp.]HMP20879.1 undecaprenyl-diphosphate phosphatase [Ferruginibacter sp.]